jgi:hypothetical protein
MYRRLGQPLQISRSFSRALSSRATNVLSALGIEPKHGVLKGVYDGKWGGTGAPVASKCPTTGEHLADVSTVRIYLILLPSSEVYLAGDPG